MAAKLGKNRLSGLVCNGLIDDGLKTPNLRDTGEPIGTELAAGKGQLFVELVVIPARDNQTRAHCDYRVT